MIEMDRDGQPLANFRRNTAEFLRQRLVALAIRAELADDLRASAEDLRAGRVTPAEDMLAEIRQILAERQAP